MTTYTPEEIALAHRLAYQAVPESSRRKSRAAAYRGALIAIRATTERAAKYTASRPCDEPRECIATAPPMNTSDKNAWPANARWNMGDWVQKKQNSAWRGQVVGFYSTAQTPIGYVVSSYFETHSVQAWPEAALIEWAPPSDY